MPRFKTLIGIPEDVLHCFALVAVFLAIYSWFCFFKLKGYYKPFLRVIATSNTIYIASTIVMLVLLHEQLSVLGMVYFTLELLIIVILIYLELQAANKHISKRQHA